MPVRTRGQGKELQCLFNIAEALVRPDLSLEQIFQGVVEELPQGFQHPDMCRARITCDGAVYETPGFEETPWKLRGQLMVQGKLTGTLDVVYLENRSLYGESPFLLDEKKLVEIVARDLPDLFKQLDGRPIKRVGKPDATLKSASFTSRTEAKTGL